jgi:hypothetical protein
VNLKTGILEKFKPVWENIGKLPVFVALWTNIEVVLLIEKLNIKFISTKITIYIGKLLKTNGRWLPTFKTISSNETTFHASDEKCFVIATP